jgi:hypothetical protein
MPAHTTVRSEKVISEARSAAEARRIVHYRWPWLRIVKTRRVDPTTTHRGWIVVVESPEA